MHTTLNSYRNIASDPMYWRTIYLKFDLRSISNMLDRVKLRIYGKVAEQHIFDLYTTTLTSWAEDALTFNNTSLEVGSISATPIATIEVQGNINPQYYECDITETVIASKNRGDVFISILLQDRNVVKDVNGAGVVVQFHSKENSSGMKPELVITEKNIEAFKLSELLINGITAEGFSGSKIQYDVLLPFNTTVVPTVTAKALNSLCSIKIINASSLNETEIERTTKIISKLGSDSLVYKVIFKLSANPNDAGLKSIFIDDVSLENFAKEKFDYHFYLPYSTTGVPTIKANASDNYANVTITPPTDLRGSKNENLAIVTVVSQNGLNSSKYSVVFDILPKLDIFLALGQSNMSGRGYMVDSDLVPINNVYLLTPGANLEIASNPLNKYSSVRKELSLQKMGPSSSFVKMMRDKTQKSIGLMQNARGGSFIESWIKGSQDRLYEEALRRALEIKKFGEIKGIIWHQGESNAGDPNGYKSKLLNMVNDFRTDLEIPDLFFIAGQIATWRSSAFNTMISTIKTFVPNSDWVSSEGLTPLIDTSDPHFDAASQKILGERYAEKMLANVYNITSNLSPKTGNNKMADIEVSNKKLEIKEITDSLTVRIYDISGKCILNQRLNQSENCSYSLSTGIYFVQLYNNQHTQFEKVFL